ncbi:hypothetical protein PBRA_003264 [Plasmodiophora brassicae]|uniref:HotDog ACOT-type domain-containing protein n=1 Tax=Plasmodiophora brassicae TaxID=37360 RepID=A0A0G4J839_PLABS|nr:hypothetical protein PBRA_003264 [Plasmodiophora brassicae]
MGPERIVAAGAGACIAVAGGAAALRYYLSRNKNGKPKVKVPEDSIVEGLETLTPSQCTMFNICYGGELLAMVDKIAGICAIRHSEGSVVTVSMDEIHFRTPARVSDIIILTAKVTAAFSSSMEIEVVVYVEHPLTGQRDFCCRALLKFVALSEKRRPRPVPALEPETPEERAAYKAAQQRNRAFKERVKARVIDVPKMWAAHLETLTALPPGLVEVPVEDTKLSMTKAVMPAHANPLGIAFGGTILQWMEQAAQIAALRLCRSAILTVGLDKMKFVSQVPVGSCVIVRAQVNRVFRTSMEVGVRVEVVELKHLPTFGSETDAGEHTNSGYFTFVAVKEGSTHPQPIDKDVKPGTDRDKLRYLQAGERRRGRMNTRQRALSGPAPLPHSSPKTLVPQAAPASNLEPHHL